MSILFVDFDGVLNTLSHKPATEHWRSGPTPEDGHLWLERPLVERLSGLVEETKCMVVFHTTWIYGFTTDELEVILRRAGFRADASFASCQCMGRREERIMSFRGGYDLLQPFAVLDDDWSRSEFPTAALGRLVHVEPGTGLSVTDALRARSLLMGWPL